MTPSYITIYILERKTKDGFVERIQAHQKCHGWRCVGWFKQEIKQGGVC